MTWDEIKELGPLYALGAVDKDTALAVEEYLQKATPEQRREVAEWSEVAALIPMALPATTVSPDLKDRLMTRIAMESQSASVSENTAQVQPAKVISTELPDPSAKVLPFTPHRRVESGATRWLLVAATVLLSLVSGYLFWQNTKLNSERNDLARELDKVKAEVKEFILPTTKVIAMNGEEAPQASAKLVWDTKRQTWVIYIYNLPEPPTDKDYQLWYLTKDAAKISAAVFRTNERGEYELKLTLPPDVVSGLAATAVTLEPKGGSQQPTGNIFLKGAI